MTWKRSRHGLASNMTFPSPVIQKIALYIQDSSDFFAFLTCFDDESLGESLGELRHFLELSKHLNPTDLWPKIQLRQLTPWLAPSVRRVASFFTAISVFEVYDVSLLRKCLHPHNIVDLVITPSDNADRAWLTAPFSMLPVQHITFQSPDYWTGDLFVEQMLGSMPNLPGSTLCLHPSKLQVDTAQFVLLYVSCRGEGLVLFNRIGDRKHVTQPRRPPSRLHGQQLEILTEWLHRCPVTSFELGRWRVNGRDETSVVALLDAVFASSTLKHVTFSNTPVGRFLPMTSFAAPIRMQSVAFTYISLNGTAYLGNADASFLNF
ncbi:hypothetical protein Ae201684_009322 [Aphanomyces euteiches]|uniref:F-box domain-containing protein n=1 Tax=Aphanomyces euteiches TaxID=100861 RepID=A0A6G0X1Q6_9STRA|nr:hypothetical protein Ae201684_009322 [Aphanomyces euteiches]